MITKKDKILFVEVLLAIEKRSTCIKEKVGCIIVRDGRIISTGWNGVPSKQKECIEFFKNKDMDLECNKILHHNWQIENEIHAEQNAIAYAAKNGISTNNSILIVSLIPCIPCSKVIIAAGITEVYYRRDWDYNNGEKLLKKCGVKIYKL